MIKKLGLFTYLLMISCNPFKYERDKSMFHKYSDSFNNAHAYTTEFITVDNNKSEFYLKEECRLYDSVNHYYKEMNK